MAAIWDVLALYYVMQRAQVLHITWRPETGDRRQDDGITGLILGLRPANERRRYIVTPSLIGWAQTWNQFWNHYTLWSSGYGEIIIETLCTWPRGRLNVHRMTDNEWE